MNKSKKTLLLILTAALLFSAAVVSLSADTGPKPFLEITLLNAPGQYYLDLLIQTQDSEVHPNLSDNEREKLNADMLALLEGYNKDGWHPAYVKGTRAPLHGSIKPDNYINSFSYFGAPETFKIIIVSNDGSVKVSDIFRKTSYFEKLTVDYNTMKIKTNAGHFENFILQFLSAFIPTVIIEFFILFLFKKSIYLSKRNIIVFITANFVTQLILAIFVSYNYTQNGLSIWLAPLFLLIEIGITISEATAYAFLFRSKKRSLSVLYGVIANIVSLLIGTLPGLLFYFKLLF